MAAGFKNKDLTPSSSRGDGRSVRIDGQEGIPYSDLGEKRVNDTGAPLPARRVRRRWSSGEMVRGKAPRQAQYERMRR